MAATKPEIQSNSAPAGSGYFNCTITNASIMSSIREQKKRSEDGYKWRKYGEKQVKTHAVITSALTQIAQ